MEVLYVSCLAVTKYDRRFSLLLRGEGITCILCLRVCAQIIPVGPEIWKVGSGKQTDFWCFGFFFIIIIFIIPTFKTDVIRKINLSLTEQNSSEG